MSQISTILSSLSKTAKNHELVVTPFLPILSNMTTGVCILSNICRFYSFCTVNRWRSKHFEYYHLGICQVIDCIASIHCFFSLLFWFVSCFIYSNCITSHTNRHVKKFQTFAQTNCTFFCCDWLFSANIWWKIVLIFVY